MKKINLDQGFFFGIGVFETILLSNGKPQFLSYHLSRLLNGIKTLNFAPPFKYIEALEEELLIYIEQHNLINSVVKIAVSPENLVFTHRKNPYTFKDYEEGFRLDFSSIARNESSPFTYIKSLNYGENFMEFTRARSEGFHDTIFLNSHDMVTETSTANIFFVKGFNIYTPKLSCGLLPGTIRQYLIDTQPMPITETAIFSDELDEYDEAFITNSVLGIMPIHSINNTVYSKGNSSSLLSIFLLDSYNSK